MVWAKYHATFLFKPVNCEPANWALLFSCDGQEKKHLVLPLLKVLFELFETLWKFCMEIVAHKKDSVHLTGGY